MGRIFKRTARLFARPSFIEGIARVLDMGSTLNVYNTNETPEKADFEALKSDWVAVADELYAAASIFEKEHKIER